MAGYRAKWLLLATCLPVAGVFFWLYAQVNAHWLSARIDQTLSQLDEQAVEITDRISRMWPGNDGLATSAICQKAWGMAAFAPQEFSMSIFVLSPAGTHSRLCRMPLTTTAKSPGADPPVPAEVTQAWLGERQWKVRPTAKGQPETLTLAVPVYHQAKVVAVLRITGAMQVVKPDGISLAQSFLVGGLLLGVSLFIIAWRWENRLEQTREKLEAQVVAMLKAPSTVSGPPNLAPLREMDGVSREIDRANEEIQQRFATLTQRLKEQAAVLDSMVEGVIAVDTRQRILDLNRAASEMLEMTLESARGKNLVEIIRNPELLRFVEDTLTGATPGERELELAGLHIQAHGTLLKDASGQGLGALVVLNDVTRLRRLETMRKEFVDNVSHELKTPITSIKGFVETLLDNKVEYPENTRRFLGIISRQSERLHAIIEDLLNLSRIEEDQQSARLETGAVSAKHLLQNAMEEARAQAVEKEISLVVDCGDDLEMELNSELMEQALVNLISNALRYSPEKTRVTLSARDNTHEWVIGVRDEGPGIPREHHPRLFERFYRVDRARSRKLGGTGLGLAIVKHIAQAHGGRVTLQSTPGEGSFFTLHIPKNIES